MAGQTPFPRQLPSPSVTSELLPSFLPQRTVMTTTATMAMPTHKTRPLTSNSSTQQCADSLYVTVSRYFSHKKIFAYLLPALIGETLSCAIYIPLIIPLKYFCTLTFLLAAP